MIVYLKKFILVIGIILLVLFISFSYFKIVDEYNKLRISNVNLPYDKQLLEHPYRSIKSGNLTVVDKWYILMTDYKGSKDIVNNYTGYEIIPDYTGDLLQPQTGERNIYTLVEFNNPEDSSKKYSYQISFAPYLTLDDQKILRLNITNNEFNTTINIVNNKIDYPTDLTKKQQDSILKQIENDTNDMFNQYVNQTYKYRNLMNS